MKNFPRRQFLQIAGAAVSSRLLPENTVLDVLQSAATSLPSAVDVMPVVLAALNGATEAFSNLFDGYDPFDKFFYYKAPPATTDEVFKELGGNIETFFRQASIMAGHMRVVQEHLEEANNALAAAWPEFEVWDAWRYVADRRLVASSLIRWIDDPIGTADEKMAALEKYYASRGPSPFNESSLVDWEKPSAEVLVTLREKVVAVSSRIQGKPPCEASDLIAAEEERLLGSLWSYVYQEFSMEAFDKVYDDVGVKFDALAERYGLSKDAIWYFKHNRELKLAGNDEISIRLNLNESPVQILSKIQKALHAIPEDYRNRKRRWYLKESPNAATFEEVCQRLPDFIEDIVPRMAVRYFPEEVVRAVDKGIQRESANERNDFDTQKKFKATEPPQAAARNSVSIGERLLVQEFGSRIWTDRHKGRKPLLPALTCV